MRARAFLEALSKRINCVVFTRFPVHERQFHVFNLKLYGMLGEGKSVERAVQRARQDVNTDRPLGDAGAFGSFALITGPQSDTQLVVPATGDPRDSAPKSQEPREDGAPVEAVEAQPTDAFGRG